jgi:hypothetical protein
VSSTKPPVNTATRRSSSRSSSESRLWLQSTDARSVRWRSVAVRGPPVSSRKRSDSPAAIWSTDSIRTRAAASSIANGSPSNSLQICATGSAFSSLRAKSGRTLRARSTNSDTASDPASTSLDPSVPGADSDSDGTRQSVSPATASGARLVASTTTSGPA